MHIQSGCSGNDSEVVILKMMSKVSKKTSQEGADVTGTSQL